MNSQSGLQLLASVSLVEQYSGIQRDASLQ